MTKKQTPGALLALLLLLPQTSAAQSARTPQGETASVTFTFAAACEDCATQGAAAGEGLYLVDVPASNNPSPSKSGAAGDLSMEVRLAGDRLVYAIPFRPGTSPRAVWRGAGKVLQVIFVPRGAPPGEAARSAGAPQAAAAPEETPRAPADAARAVAAITTPAALPTHAAAPKACGAAAPSLSAPPALAAAAPQTAGALAGLLPLLKPVDRDEKGSTRLAAVDLSVPESPAFTVLGVTPQTVVRPTSPRQFASSLLSGVDMNGNFQSGLALDFVPYLVFMGDELTLRGYQQSYLTRLLSRTQVSFASTKGASDDDKSMRLALGFHATLWDRGDPRTDEQLFTCLGQMRTPRRPDQLEPELLGTTPEELRAFNEATSRYNQERARYERDRQAAVAFNNGVSTRCRDESRRRNWNRSSWIVAGAPSWISTDGKTGNYHWNGGGFWTSLAYGFEGVEGLRERSQLIVHARYRNREQVPDPDEEGAFFTQDSMFFGARFRYGSPVFNGSFEYTLLRARRAGGSFDNAQRLALGLERRIAGDTWFNLSLGGEGGRADGKNNGFVLTSFKWGFSGRRDVTPPEPDAR